MNNHGKPRLDRPLPAPPASPRRISTSIPAAAEIKLPKSRGRNRLKKRGVQNTTDTLHQSSFSSLSSDPDITPKPLAIRKLPTSNTSSIHGSGIDLQSGGPVQSRWSTSTSDVASSHFIRKDSKRKIFGIPISFKRRVKSEQIPPRLQVSSGFFGGRWPGSKLSLAMSSSKANNKIEEQQWRSSRVSSSMTIRGADGTLSDEDVIYDYQFSAGNDGEYLTPKGRLLQRRHTLTGSLLGMSKNPSKVHLPPSNLSRNSEIHSSARSFSDSKKISFQNFLSLFPKPPRREGSEVMRMLTKNATMPLILETSEYQHTGRPQGIRNPLPSNWRDSFLPQGHQRNVSDITVHPCDSSNPSQVFLPGLKSDTAREIHTTPLMTRISGIAVLPTPKSIVYTTVYKKPVISHINLRVTADIDTIEIGETKDVWVVVELNGSLANNREIVNSPQNGLDVVFLLDLS
ncbi:hypothetical protein ABW20_dc0108423 [Dactylellina cionopaga]|nr:hypothetical protein ABW20_dc0108423 [Dactylellina cionopaga]